MAFERNKFGEGCENWFPRFQRNVWREKTCAYKKIHKKIPNLSKKNRTLGEKVSTVFPKPHSTCAGELFESFFLNFICPVNQEKKFFDWYSRDRKINKTCVTFAGKFMKGVLLISMLSFRMYSCWHLLDKLHYVPNAVFSLRLFHL